jgi:hypothetical protein
MKEQRRKTPIARPADEATAEQSTQEAGGLHEGLQGVRPGPGPELARERDAEDVLNRSAEDRYATPRRYDNDADDPALPADDATLKTNI